MKKNYFVWGGDCFISLHPSGILSENLVFSGFIKESNEVYVAPDYSLEHAPMISFKNFLRQSRVSESILVLFFKAKWANRYLYEKLKLLETNPSFKIQVMDITEFSIKFGFARIYDDQSLVRDKIIEKTKEWEYLINNLSDNFSKLSMRSYLRSFFETSTKPILDYLIPQDLDTFNPYSTKFSFVPSDEEIYVDVGAYDGDSVLKFINTTPTGLYKSIHAFEPNPSYFPILKAKSEWLPNLTAHQLALSNKTSSLSFVNEKMGSRFATEEDKNLNKKIIEVKAFPLDEILEDATLIKIDVEGFESEVVEGAAKLIRKCKPQLIIDTYHHANDALKIYETVMSIYNYKYVGWRMSHHDLHSFYFSDTQKLV
jgi:FkbM family methyltransferase